MKPVASIGVKDDCLRQCVASILEMHPRRVPNFVKRFRDRWIDELQDWLFDRDMYLSGFGLDGFGGLQAPWIPKGYWIAVVDNRADVSHAIVMRGQKKVFDPEDWMDKRRRYWCGYEILPITFP